MTQAFNSFKEIHLNFMLTERNQGSWRTNELIIITVKQVLPVLQGTPGVLRIHFIVKPARG